MYENYYALSANIQKAQKIQLHARRRIPLIFSVFKLCEVDSLSKEVMLL